METIRERGRHGRRNGLIGQTSMLYDDDCMAAWNAEETKSAGFTFRSFMCLNQANKNDRIAGKSFLRRL